MPDAEIRPSRRLRWLMLDKPAEWIAEREGLSVRTVHRELALAREEVRRYREASQLLGKPDPHVVPRFGAKPFTPQTTCEDIRPTGPIRRGSLDYCPVCHQSGVDHQLGRQSPGATGRTSVACEATPRPGTTSPAPAALAETRRERRQRLFGGKVSVEY